MSIVLVLVGVAALGAVAVVLAGRTGGQAEFAPDRASFDLPAPEELCADQLEALRFSVGARGYRMDQVDQVLDRVAAALADRDRRIAELEDPSGAEGAPGPAVTVGEPSEEVVRALVEAPSDEPGDGPDGSDASDDDAPGAPTD